MNEEPYIFYGIEISLYSGKVRSYLRKKKLPFVARGSEHPGFAKAAAKLGRGVQPLIETPEQRGRADELLAETGLMPLIGARASRRIERHGFREVFV